MNNNQSTPGKDNQQDKSENEVKETKLQKMIDMAHNPDKYSESRWDMQPGDILVTPLEDALERQRQSVEKSKKVLENLRKKNKNNVPKGSGKNANE